MKKKSIFIKKKKKSTAHSRFATLQGMTSCTGFYEQHTLDSASYLKIEKGPDVGRWRGRE